MASTGRLLILGVLLGSFLLSLNVVRLLPEDNPVDFAPAVGLMGNLPSTQHSARHGTVDIWSFPSPMATRLDDSGPFYRNRAKAHREFNSTVQFVFNIGLEGTGHHLMESVVRASPAFRWFNERNIWQTKVGTLHKSLFQDFMLSFRVGLWNVHCLERRGNSTLLANKVAQKMRIVEDLTNEKLGNVSRQRSTWSISLPINTVAARGSGAYGMISYPSFKSTCRFSNYPDINLFQNACRKAQVDCYFLYLYRHPVAILSSIVRRGFGGWDADSMRLYTTFLHVIANQMRMYGSNMLGCFGFFSDDPRERFWQTAMQDLLLWQNVTDHAETMHAIYKPPHHSNFTDGELLETWLAETEHAPYLSSWWNAHQHALRTCRLAVKGALDIS